MLRVVLSSSSFASPELRERLRDAVQRVGCHPDSRHASETSDAHYLALLNDADVYAAVPPYSDFELAKAAERGISVVRLTPTTIDALEAELIQALTDLVSQSASADGPAIPRPPALYAVPPYALTYQFVGREHELKDLDRWAASPEPSLVFEAIGGMGKSALAWEWMEHRAAQHIPNLAGRVWWSFYERGSSMRGFVRHALAYVTETDVEDYRHADDWEVTHSLVDALRKRPFLVVLDGFERILAAYHHLEKAQIRDDQIQEDLRQSTNPLDGDLVRYLADCAPSKLLVTSRLMPKALEDRGLHHALKGLAPRDAESLARASGVKGTSPLIQNFATLFGCHALVMRVVCGMVNDYAPHPGFFDDWLADPAAGGALQLEDVDVRFRHTHVLQFALAALDPAERQLLSRIAVLSDTASYETIRVVSPYTSPVELHAALKTLGDRGLLQWDRQANTYDLHPAVRGVAFDQLERGDRAGTYKALRDHFAAMPPEDFKRATELSHLKNSIEVFRLLLGAGLLKEAASHYFGELANALMYSVGAYRVVIELLRELLKAAGPEPWKVLGARPASYILGGLTIALAHVGEVEEARELEAQTIALDLAEKDWANLSIEIRNLSLVRGLAARGEGIQLSLDLANMAGNASGAAIAYLSLAHVAASRGDYNEARKLIEKFRSYPTPGRSVYQRGDAELLQASIALEEGTLTDTVLDEGESVARTSNNLAGQKEFHLLRARWRIAQGDWSGAVTSADAAIEIIRRTGERASFPFALRSLALAKLGRPEEALDALQKASNNVYSAQACLELGAIEAAKTCVLKSYKAAWDDGAPYCYQWELDRCRELLAKLAMPEPQLAPYDPKHVERMPHEEEIRAAIARHTAAAT